MTICRFYANGYCRYGNNCRFQHMDNNTEYYQKSYNRNDGQQWRQQSQPTSAPNRTGFSFNRTLDNMATNRGFGQQPAFSSNSSVFGQRETQTHRNAFHHQNNPSFQTNQRSGTFSFNKTLQQMSGNDRPSGRLISYDDIEMDSGAIPRVGALSGSQTNTFGHFSQSNDSNLFGNKPLVSPKTEIIANTNASIGLKSSSDNKSNDIYSKESELTENDKKQFEANAFTYRSIPVCPPPQAYCV